MESCSNDFQCIRGTAHFPVDMMFCAESEAKNDLLNLLQAVLVTLQLKRLARHLPVQTHKDKILSLPRVFHIVVYKSDHKKR